MSLKDALQRINRIKQDRKAGVKPASKPNPKDSRSERKRDEVTADGKRT
jgi:hypothetical protein